MGTGRWDTVCNRGGKPKLTGPRWGFGNADSSSRSTAIISSLRTPQCCSPIAWAPSKLFPIPSRHDILHNVISPDVETKIFYVGLQGWILPPYSDVARRKLDPNPNFPKPMLPILYGSFNGHRRSGLCWSILKSSNGLCFVKVMTYPIMCTP